MSCANFSYHSRRRQAPRPLWPYVAAEIPIHEYRCRRESWTVRMKSADHSRRDRIPLRRVWMFLWRQATQSWRAKLRRAPAGRYRRPASRSILARLPASATGSGIHPRLVGEFVAASGRRFPSKVAQRALPERARLPSAWRPKFARVRAAEVDKQLDCRRLPPSPSGHAPASSR